MKKMSVVVLALSLAVSMAGFANAGYKNGMGGGCGDCSQRDGGAPSGPFRKFQADTIDLRQEMMMKRFEVQRENLKGAPDQAKIASLKDEIKALQTKILDIRSKSGLPEGKRDGECGPAMGDCTQASGGCNKMGMGGRGKGMGGCNNGPCGGQK